MAQQSHILTSHNISFATHEFKSVNVPFLSFVFGECYAELQQIMPLKMGSFEPIVLPPRHFSTFSLLFLMSSFKLSAYGERNF
jgi:hypothetical protein